MTTSIARLVGPQERVLSAVLARPDGHPAPAADRLDIDSKIWIGELDAARLSKLFQLAEQSVTLSTAREESLTGGSPLRWFKRA